jgi:hypothetical protein
MQVVFASVPMYQNSVSTRIWCESHMQWLQKLNESQRKFIDTNETQGFDRKFCRFFGLETIVWGLRCINGSVIVIQQNGRGFKWKTTWWTSPTKWARKRSASVKLSVRILPQKPECLSLWVLHERLQAGEKVWKKVWSLYLVLSTGGSIYCSVETVANYAQRKRDQTRRTLVSGSSLKHRWIGEAVCRIPIRRQLWSVVVDGSWHAHIYITVAIVTITCEQEARYLETLFGRRRFLERTREKEK